MSGTVSPPERRHTGRAVDALLRLRRHYSPVEGLIGARKWQGGPSGRGWPVSARRHAVRTARVQLHVGGVADGDRGDARVALDVLQSWRRGSATGWPIRIARRWLHVLIRRSRAVQGHLRTR